MSAVARDTRGATAIARLLEEELGFAADAQREPEIAKLLDERLRVTGCASVDAYLARLGRPEARAVELTALAARLTVGETYFFREPAHLDVVVEAVRAGARRILSAGCSSGEEPYTIAIALREALGAAAERVEITAIDVSHRAVEGAREGVYSDWALRATSAQVRARWFQPVHDGGSPARAGSAPMPPGGAGRYTLSPPIRSAVRFSVKNLLEDDPALYSPGAFDVIVCRNVFIYFSPQAIAATLARFAIALGEGGVLVLGSADSVGLIQGPFELAATREVLCFRRRGAAPPEPVEPKPAPRHRRKARHSTRPPNAPPLDLEAIAASVREGRFADAERACRDALAAGSGSAEAHYVLGLCSEHAGDVGAAMKHHASAIARDPSFALAHLRLGLLARSIGDRALSCRALSDALRAMPNEAPARLSLFGGGFRREALSELCATLLSACEGTP